ncbi:KilA-N domain-containing protein [Salmonella enterica subsp. enterica serovar Florida]|nr:KilA-N domain-containing protein [Salmonella enterica subsp. enterica serovar Florida]
MSTGNKLPVVVGVEIPLDESGRYNLNTIHKASGEGDDKSPGQWLRRKTTKELIKELDANLLKNSQDVNLHSAQKSINVVNGGTNPGTFAHELLAVSYAGWIRASFQRARFYVRLLQSFRYSSDPRVIAQTGIVPQLSRRGLFYITALLHQYGDTLADIGVKDGRGMLVTPQEARALYAG